MYPRVIPPTSRQDFGATVYHPSAIHLPSPYRERWTITESIFFDVLLHIENTNVDDCVPPCEKEVLGMRDNTIAQRAKVSFREILKFTSITLVSRICLRQGQRGLSRSHNLLRRIRDFVGLAATLSLTLALTSCIESRETIFDSSEAVQTFSEGNYRIVALDGSMDKTITVKLDGSGYKIDGLVDESVSITVFEIDNDLYALDLSGKEHHIYTTATVRDGAFLIHDSSCSGYTRATSTQGNSSSDPSNNAGTSSSCRFDNNEKLFAALREHATGAKVAFRMTPIISPVSPQSEKMLPDVSTFTMCNTSTTDAAAIFHHRHLHDPGKWLLDGWLSIPGGQCKPAGPFPKEGLSFFALGNGGGVEWAGKAKFFCISPRGTYRVTRDNEQCIAGEARKGFSNLNIEGNSYKHNLR